MQRGGPNQKALKLPLSDTQWRRRSKVEWGRLCCRVTVWEAVQSIGCNIFSYWRQKIKHKKIINFLKNWGDACARPHHNVDPPLLLSNICNSCNSIEDTPKFINPPFWLSSFRKKRQKFIFFFCLWSGIPQT